MASSPGLRLWMKTRSLALYSLIVFLFSCAGGPGVLDEPPEWVSLPVSDTDTQRAFRGIGEGESLALARDEAIDSLIDAVLDAMEIGDPEGWSDGARKGVAAFSNDLGQVVRSPEFYEMDGLEVFRRNGWRNDSGGVTYAVDIYWENSAFDAKALELADLLGVAGPEYRALEKRARTAEADGNFYESALLWAAAAGVAENDGNFSGYRMALRGIESVLDNFEYTVISVPEEAYVGLRPASPVLFGVEKDGKRVGNAEFVITYPRAARDGSPSRGEARISSDKNGVVSFLPPEVAFAGIQNITIALSARPFLEYLEDPANSATDQFIADLETSNTGAVYEALARLRTIPMGILILETDLTGNPLDSSAAANGLLDDLIGDGFDVEVMDLNPREMISRSERALLRDIKADPRFLRAI